MPLLELQNEKMRRALYGQRSERGQLLIDQLELGLEELEAADRGARSSRRAAARRRHDRAGAGGDQGPCRTPMDLRAR